ncbi:MAG TPA: formylglycine-generating enzyme family protein [Opitutaceae bacterium]|jgi:formylglycine-generating enzyme required for sulfatase activity|nr:formylglycine-generating enzyme family protein [Opitutaceae bacterium]
MIREIIPAPPLVRLPAGSFLMGETPGDKFALDTERPAHPVEIPRPYGLGRYPVTVEEYRRFAPGFAAEEPAVWPAAGVSWDDAQAYCAWLRNESGRPYRLPAEAEWEYACRAHSRAPFSGREEMTPAAANFLYAEDGTRVGPGERTAVGRYPANAFGLHDLLGNVCEWVEDLWHRDYRGAPGDGSAWLQGEDSEMRTIRGGAWDYLPRLLRSTWRDSLPRGRRRDNVGFRVALTLA